MEKNQEKKEKGEKERKDKNNTLNIHYNELFLSYELNNYSNDKKNSYKKNKSLIFI